MLSLSMLQEWYLVHRVDLHNHLKKRALETATLHTQCRIITIDISGSRPSVTLDDGRTFEADLLLGADGLHVCTDMERVGQGDALTSFAVSSPWYSGAGCASSIPGWQILLPMDSTYR